MQRYGLGRTPIREALKQLRNDQLIVWPDRRSPYVPEIGVAQVKSLYEARSIFETQIAALAAQRITEDAAARLDELVAQQADFVERNMAYEAAEVDLLFHKGVAEATGNQFLVDASTRVNISALRIWHEMVVTEGMIAAGARRHRRRAAATRCPAIGRGGRGPHQQLLPAIHPHEHPAERPAVRALRGVTAGMTVRL